VPNLLVDTDVFVDHVRSARQLRTKGNKTFYSVVTRAELYMGGHERVVDRTLEPHTEIEIDRAIAQRAGRIRRSVDIGFQDALIAATALEHRLVLISRNTRDFGRVPKLRVRPDIP
jgi:predicted nucleic acid-binding protein